MHLAIFALALTNWGIVRFTTDSFALIELVVLISLPIQLLKDKAGFKNIWKVQMLSQTDKKVFYNLSSMYKL